MNESVLLEASNTWLVTAIDVSAKAVLLATLAGLALRLARIGDPNLRHRVWTGILLAMLALPILSQLLPALRLPFAIDAGWLLAQQNQDVAEVNETPPVWQDNSYLATANPRLNEAQELRPFIEPEARLAEPHREKSAS